MESEHNRRNHFFDPPGDGEEPRGGRVYAAIEVPEPDEGVNRATGSGDSASEPVLLECIDTQWFGSMQSGEKPLLWTDIFRVAPLSVLELTGYPLPPFPEGAQPGDVAWFEFGYEPAPTSTSDARIYTSLYSDGSAVKIKFHEPRSLDWAPNGPMGATGWLTGVLASSGLQAESAKAFSTMLSAVDCSGGVAVYDVGQGACQAALDRNLHIPSLYIDFGGGVLVNRKTFPDAYTGFCFSRRPSVLLSHWDWDHWSSAYRFEEALSVPWLAPPVPHKPIQQAFAADLYVRGMLHVWDETWPAVIRKGAIRVERCTGRTTNDSGLAVTLYPNGKSRRNCLLPGDAGYAHVPSVRAGEAFSSMCLSHHGGRLHSNLYPKPKHPTTSALSAGPRNSYKHPLFSTVAMHLEQGWSFPIPTAMSGQRPCHVLLQWGKPPHVFRGGCHGQSCNSAIAQIAPASTTVSQLAQLPPLETKVAITA